MKHQAIAENIGHFDNEIDMAGLATWLGVERVNVKPQVDEWQHRRPLDHRPLRGPAAQPRQRDRTSSFVMSNSFTNQTIAQIELFTKNDKYDKQVYVLPSTSTRRWRACTWTHSAPASTS